MPCYLAELLIPRFTKAACQRLAQKPIDGKPQGFPFFYGIFADVPTVIVQADKFTLKALFTDGIQRTADRFAELGLPIAIGTFQGTQAIVAVITER